MFVREEGWCSKKVSDLFKTVEELDHHELFDTISPLLIRVIEGKITYTSRPGAAYGKKICELERADIGKLKESQRPSRLAQRPIL